jgi:hypothetical protein
VRQRIDAIDRTSIAKTVKEYRRILRSEISGSGLLTQVERCDPVNATPIGAPYGRIVRQGSYFTSAARCKIDHMEKRRPASTKSDEEYRKRLEDNLNWRIFADISLGAASGLWRYVELGRIISRDEVPKILAGTWPRRKCLHPRRARTLRYVDGGQNGPAEVMPALSRGWWKGWRGPNPLTD